MDEASVCGVGEHLPVSYFETKETFHLRNKAHCPYCGEKLTYVPSFISNGHQVKSFFRHHKNKNYKDCEKRSKVFYSTPVHIHSESLRYILPYVVKNGEGYGLVIRLAAISEFKDSKDFVVICNRRYSLERFFLNKSEIQLFSIPTRSNNRLNVPDMYEDLIKERWGLEIDCISEGGSFFKTNSGKKIPVGGTIYYNTEYLLVSKKFPHSFLKPIALGKLNFNHEFQVFKVSIPKKEYVTSDLILYLHSCDVKVTLSDCAPKLIWPPSAFVGEKYCPLFKNLKTIIRHNGESEASVSPFSSDHLSDMPITRGSYIDYFSNGLSEYTIFIKYGDRCELIEFGEINDACLSPLREHYLHEEDGIQKISLDVNGMIVLHHINKVRQISRDREIICGNTVSRIDIYSKYRFVAAYEFKTIDEESNDELFPPIINTKFLATNLSLRKYILELSRYNRALARTVMKSICRNQTLSTFQMESLRDRL